LKAGTKLRLAVQLIDAVSGAHLWAETYERMLVRKLFSNFKTFSSSASSPTLAFASAAKTAYPTFASGIKLVAAQYRDNR